jgi:hypothetical protein
VPELHHNESKWDTLATLFATPRIVDTRFLHGHPSGWPCHFSPTNFFGGVGISCPIAVHSYFIPNTPYYCGSSVLKIGGSRDVEKTGSGSIAFSILFGTTLPHV